MPKKSQDAQNIVQCQQSFLYSFFGNCLFISSCLAILYGRSKIMRKSYCPHETVQKSIRHCHVLTIGQVPVSFKYCSVHGQVFHCYLHLCHILYKNFPAVCARLFNSLALACHFVPSCLHKSFTNNSTNFLPPPTSMRIALDFNS